MGLHASMQVVSHNRMIEFDKNNSQVCIEKSYYPYVAIGATFEKSGAKRLLQCPVQLSRGKNLDFCLSTVPIIGRYEKLGGRIGSLTSHSDLL